MYWYLKRCNFPNTFVQLLGPPQPIHNEWLTVNPTRNYETSRDICQLNTLWLKRGGRSWEVQGRSPPMSTFLAARRSGRYSFAPIYYFFFSLHFSYNFFTRQCTYFFLPTKLLPLQINPLNNFFYDAGFQTETRKHKKFPMFLYNFIDFKQT